jgi:hypothetical protein
MAPEVIAVAAAAVGAPGTVEGLVGVEEPEAGSMPVAAIKARAVASSDAATPGAADSDAGIVELVVARAGPVLI